MSSERTPRVNGTATKASSELNTNQVWIVFRYHWVGGRGIHGLYNNEQFAKDVAAELKRGGRVADTSIESHVVHQASKVVDGS